MSTLAEAATEKDVYLSEFNRLEKELSRRGRPGVQRLRRAAIARFDELGFPTPRRRGLEIHQPRAANEGCFPARRTDRPSSEGGAAGRSSWHGRGLPPRLRGRLFRTRIVCDDGLAVWRDRRQFGRGARRIGGGRRGAPRSTRRASRNTPLPLSIRRFSATAPLSSSRKAKSLRRRSIWSSSPRRRPSRPCRTRATSSWPATTADSLSSKATRVWLTM